ncbi:hypothetical protein GEV33_007523 [Tenebrio molitor]|uniref:BTB domain-containing protein n=1 Tax=Tenebrio molitor TaxID=7067 RepID=A0A8J6HKH6_TENMO|nr:hypothetical protein GEV33_007523 [Tenebrio molitor]
MSYVEKIPIIVVCLGCRGGDCRAVATRSCGWMGGVRAVSTDGGGKACAGGGLDPPAEPIVSVLPLQSSCDDSEPLRCQDCKVCACREPRVWTCRSPSAAMQHSTGSPQQFCLRWNNYQSNLTNVFDQLLQSESFVDVTLACDGHSVKAHKMVLSACSPYFQSLFFENPCQHPIVIMRDIKWPELKAAVEFMYKGEINVSQEQIGPLLKVAESLKIRGLADVNGEQDIVAPTGELTTSARTLLKSASTPNNVAEWEARPEGDGPPRVKKRRRPSGERSSLSSPAESASTEIPDPPPSVEMSPAPSATPLPSSVSTEPLPLTLPLPQQPQVSHASSDDMEIKPGIAEMIREEERTPVTLLDPIHPTKKARIHAHQWELN